MNDFQGVKPHRWPERVPPPGAHGGPWEATAQKWLWDQVPGQWRDGLSGRQYQRYPRMLARDALYLVQGQLDGLRKAYRAARVELGPYFEPQQIEERLAMYAADAERLDQVHVEIQLVYDALAGVRWIPRN